MTSCGALRDVPGWAPITTTGSLVQGHYVVRLERLIRLRPKRGSSGTLIKMHGTTWIIKAYGDINGLKWSNEHPYWVSPQCGWSICWVLIGTLLIPTL